MFLLKRKMLTLIKTKYEGHFSILLSFYYYDFKGLITTRQTDSVLKF